MAFSEACQLIGIFAFAYPTDFSRCHTPVPFHRKAVGSPCVGPGDTVAIVPTDSGRTLHVPHSDTPSARLHSTGRKRPRAEGEGRKEGMH